MKQSRLFFAFSALYGFVVLLILSRLDLASYAQQGDPLARYGAAFAREFLASGNIELAVEALPNRYPPLFGLMCALFMWLAPTHYLYIIVLSHFAMLYVAALFIAHGFARENENLRLLTFSFIAFNPYYLLLAMIPEKELLHFFIFCVGLYFLLNYLRDFRQRQIVWAGCFLALSAYARSGPEYLIALLPVVTFMFCPNKAQMWRQSIRHGLVAALVAAAIVAPWLAHNHSHGHGVSMTGASTEALYLLDNMRGVNPFEKNLPEPHKERLIREFKEQVSNLEPNAIAATTPVFKDARFPAFIRTEFLLHLRENLASLPRTLTYSAGMYFSKNFSGRFNFLISGERRGTGWYLQLPTAVSILLRFLGLLGIVYFARKRQYAPLLFWLGLVTFFFAVSMFRPDVRYRCNAEALACILALYGLRSLSFTKRIFSPKEAAGQPA